MAFNLFLLVNAALFLRPGELIPAIAEIPIYNILMLAALAVSIPRIAERLNPDRLRKDPITCCVLGLVPAIAVSHLAHFDTYSARFSTLEFSKSVVYYLILISVIDTARRLRLFLYAVALFASVNLTIAVLHYYEIIEVPALTVLQQRDINPDTDEVYVIPRLRATGIFHDPNDLSMMAVVGIVVCIFGLGDRQFGLMRYGWALPLALGLWGLFLTKSRGGFLALVAAGATFAYMRFGLWKTVAAAVFCLPVLVAIAGPRQVDMGGALSKGTGSDRVRLWSEGLMLFKQAPVFGIGSGNYVDEVRQVAHNSFLHCFTELGLCGGALFLGAFWFAGVSLWNLRRRMPLVRSLTGSDVFVHVRPCISAVLAGYTVSLLSLSRSYVVPTYMILGTASAFCLESSRLGLPPLVTLTPRRLGQLLAVSMAYLVAIYVFVRVMIRY